MRNVRLGLLTAGLLLTTAVPLAAQTQSPNGSTVRPAPSGTVSEATVDKAGAALRQVATINSVYAQRVDGARSDNERDALKHQAMDEAAKAVTDQGLTIGQYNQVIELAQADPRVKQRLLNAANGH